MDTLQRQARQEMISDANESYQRDIEIPRETALSNARDYAMIGTLGSVGGIVYGCANSEAIFNYLTNMTNNNGAFETIVTGLITAINLTLLGIANHEARIAKNLKD